MNFNIYYFMFISILISFIYMINKGNKELNKSINFLLEKINEEKLEEEDDYDSIDGNQFKKEYGLDKVLKSKLKLTRLINDNRCNYYLNKNHMKRILIFNIALSFIFLISSIYIFFINNNCDDLISALLIILNLIIIILDVNTAISIKKIVLLNKRIN